MQRLTLLLLVASISGACARAPATESAVPATVARRSGTEAAIAAEDLRERLEIFAHDSMEGRRAGSEGDARATAYLAAQVRALGLEPAGDAGSFLQAVPLLARTVTASSLSLGGTPLAAWTDYLPLDNGLDTYEFESAESIFGGSIADSVAALNRLQSQGKFVVLTVPRGAFPRIPRPIAERFGNAAALGIALFDDPTPAQISQARTGSLGLPSNAPPWPKMTVALSPLAARLLFGRPVEELAAGMTGPGARGSARVAQSARPAHNVVAILRGSDPALRGQFVAIGAHSDHIGVRQPAVDRDSVRAFNTALYALQLTGQRVSPAQRAAIRVNMDSIRRLHPTPRLDSISNGADDDGSGSVAMLELAEAFAKGERPRRSLLFVWHSGEEIGLLGARYYTDNPTVARDSIVAQLNMDMIGRGGAGEIANGGAGYLQLVGSRRLSTELGDIIESINRGSSSPFRFDYGYDANGHPENIYCRSDHAMYARYGIPVTFFHTGLHRDYHQVTDEVQFIDFRKLAAVTQLVHDVALHVGNLDHRVVVDHPKPDPGAPCRQ
jgi:hypothetical protein